MHKVHFLMPEAKTTGCGLKATKNRKTTEVESEVTCQGCTPKSPVKHFLEKKTDKEGKIVIPAFQNTKCGITVSQNNPDFREQSCTSEKESVTCPKCNKE